MNTRPNDVSKEYIAEDASLVNKITLTIAEFTTLNLYSNRLGAKQQIFLTLISSGISNVKREDDCVAITIADIVFSTQLIRIFNLLQRNNYISAAFAKKILDEPTNTLNREIIRNTLDTYLQNFSPYMYTLTYNDIRNALDERTGDNILYSAIQANNPNILAYFLSALSTQQLSTLLSPGLTSQNVLRYAQGSMDQHLQHYYDRNQTLQNNSANRQQENHDSVTKPVINGAQENIIAGTLKFIFEDITTTLSPSQALKLFNKLDVISMSADQFTETEIELCKKNDLWDGILQITDILHHPCPENRAQGDGGAYWHAELKGRQPVTRCERTACETGVCNGIVYYYKSGFGSEILTEKQGLLSLTARNDNTAPPVTRGAVMDYIHELLQKEIKQCKLEIKAATTIAFWCKNRHKNKNIAPVIEPAPPAPRPGRG